MNGSIAIKAALIFVPLSIILKLLNVNPIFIFFTTAITVMLLSMILSNATENLSKYLGMTIGVLMNVTFGNLIELLILFFALKEGLIDIVKASITGSIVANLLLILGLSILAGGIKHKHLAFNIEYASMNATMLTLAIIALAIPTAFYYQGLGSGNLQVNLQQISLAAAVILLVIYFCSILFSVFTHKELFIARYKKETVTLSDKLPLSMTRSLLILLVSTVTAAYISEILIESIVPFSSALKLTDTFMGVIVIAIIANATEHVVAVTTAINNKVDLSLGVSAGSSSQIALFIAPILVISSFIMGTPITLVFSTMELVAIFASVIIYDVLSTDGRFVWFEGVVFLAIYILFGYAFLLIP